MAQRALGQPASASCVTGTSSPPRIRTSARCATPPSSPRATRSSGSARPGAPPRPTGGSTSAAERSSPGSSTPTRTWCSPATGRASSPPGCAGSATTAGGIASTVAATRAADDDALRALLAGPIAELRAQGTTTVEIKSGYGLTVADEERALRLAAEVTAETTFLGAHVVPRHGAARAEYLALVIGPMLAACAPHARWIDVFCEPASPHAFDGDEARAVLEAGRAAGLGLRLHGNQLGPGPGVALAVELGAASVDHCTYLTDADVDALAGGDTVATLLPGVEFSTRSPYPDARRLLDAGVPLALATDCNPGTCASSSMPLMIALAVREMGLTPAEALHAATAGAARALRRTDVGVVAPGRRADLDGPRRPEPPPTWPTGRASRSRAPGSDPGTRRGTAPSPCGPPLPAGRWPKEDRLVVARGRVGHEAARALLRAAVDGSSKGAAGWFW